MKLRFLHAADIHLGYHQYGLAERYDDFADGFQWIIETALEERVAFLLVAGDLFESRTLDPLTLLIAVKGFERLKAAGIPVIAIEGNHDRVYGEGLSWMEYLNQNKLLYLLDCTRRDDGWLPQPWDDTERSGGYVDLGGVRIYGLKYRGAQTGTALEAIGELLPLTWSSSVKFSVFSCHTAIRGLYDGSSRKGSQSEFSVREHELSGLRQRIDYLALGHTHVPYIREFEGREWFHNPGCPETWSNQNLRRQAGGSILVNVDTSRSPSFEAKIRDNPFRREFIRFPIQLDSCPSPSALLQRLRESVKSARLPGLPRESRLFDRNAIEAHVEGHHPTKSPLVEVLLTGVARFSRTEIDTEGIREIVEEHLSPLDVRIRSLLQEAPTGMLDSEGTPRRHILERMVFQSLIRADDRFAPNIDKLAEVAGFLKQMVLDGASPTEVAEEVQSRLGPTKGVGQASAGHSASTSIQTTTEELKDLEPLVDFLSDQTQDEGSCSPSADLRDDFEQDYLPGKDPDSSDGVKTKH